MGYTETMEKISSMLQKGYECEKVYHDWRKACEYYGEARACLESLYGKGSKICSFVNLYDYVQEQYQENYRAAILRLADAGELLDSFSEKDVLDGFTAWINENRQLLLDEAVAKTWNVLQYLGFEISLEDLFLQTILIGNDMEEVMNRTIIDRLGLPRRFHYLLQQMCDGCKNYTPDMKQKVVQIYDFIHNQEGKDFSNMNQEEKARLAKALLSVLQEGNQLFTENGILGGGMAAYMKDWQKNIEFDVARGMMGLGETEFAESLFSRIKDDYDFSDISSQIKIKLVECLLAEKKGNRVRAEEILDEIEEMENRIITRVFFLKSEQERIEILKGIEYLMKRTVEVCSQVCGAERAYSMVVRTRMLSFDHTNIHLSSEEHRHVVLKMQQLESRKNAGENVTAEYNKLIDYFERVSGGIFDFDPVTIQRKLTGGQAVLEFTTMTDENDNDFYAVFVVTSQRIVSVNLGKCIIANDCIEEVLEYIENYALNKYSSCQIRALPGYYELYETVLQPISEILPYNIKTLFIAEAGDFLQLPFGILPCFHWYDKFMEDEYHINYINCGKEILRDVGGVINQGAVVIGNPDFNGKFPALPSSGKEAEAVAKLLKVNPVTGRDVVPGCLKRQARIFHISTHAGTREEAGLEKSIDPMANINLIFSDGELLSAKEINKLDLCGTDLVVLSVCGVKEEKGIYGDLGPGMRRAFINAGARHIILNLWKTDDNAAELLMKKFYDCYLNKKMSIESALREAKRFLRTSSVGAIKKGKYYEGGMEEVFSLMKEDEMPYEHPYYWAGFIAFGM